MKLHLRNRAKPGPKRTRRSSREDEAVSPNSPVHDRRRHAPSMIETASEKSRVDEFEIRVQQETQQMVQHESNQRHPGTSQRQSEMIQRTTIDDATASRDEEQLLLEEGALREKMKQLERQSFDAGAVRTELEKEAVLSVERETRLRAEAAFGGVKRRNFGSARMKKLSTAGLRSAKR